jgi:hypothetical protein
LELPPKKRGRPRKSVVKAVRGDDDEETNLKESLNMARSRDSPTLGIMAAPDNALRRRDRIKSRDRYSPPPEQPKKRMRGKTSFPSTAGGHKSGKISPFAKKGRFSTGKEAVTTELNMTRDVDGKKMLITLPDGTTYRVDATPVSSRTTKKADYDDDDEEEEMNLVGVDDNKDDDYKPTVTEKQNLKKIQTTVKKTPVRKSATGVSKLTSTIAPIKANHIKPLYKAADGTKTTAITTRMETGTSKVTLVTTPKSVTLFPALKSPPKKIYGNQSKFIEDLPELGDCLDFSVEEVSDTTPFSLLPDRIHLIYSELPLELTQIKDQVKQYAFRQVIDNSRQLRSPQESHYPCLVCPKKTIGGNTLLSLAVPVPKLNPGFFRNETELKNHYSLVHELQCDVSHAVIPDEVVFVVLDDKLLQEAKEGKEVTVNSPCQYCETLVFESLSGLQEHCQNHHSKSVTLVSKESIKRMTQVLHCFTCPTVSFSNFSNLNQHIRSAHQMISYPCKSCTFFTRDATRLKSHFKAKHMLTGSALQECGYCNGVLMGVERMNRHITTTHSIQTSEKEYSCIACLQINENPANMSQHTSKCLALTGKAFDEAKEDYKMDDECFKDSQCFYCETVFDTPTLCRLHLDHVHTDWVENDEVYTEDNKKKVLKLSDLPSIHQLMAVGVTSTQGYYCFVCDAVIQEYLLYFLHMHNVHGKRKRYQCKISSCALVFKAPQEMKQHILFNPHPQKNIISDTLGSIVCHSCDEYFMSRIEYHEHHLSEKHNSKNSSDSRNSYSLIKNYKCSVCHTWFSLRDSLIDHMERESHRHPCPYCGIDFALPSSLRTHIQSHHLERSDECEICGQKEGNRERLLSHLVTHGVLFECSMCTMKFYQKEQLNAHNETHKQKIECLWPGCGKTITPNTLSIHIKQHRLENKCKNCNKLFSSPIQLAEHVKVHEEAELNARKIMQTVTVQSTIKSSLPASKKTNCKPKPIQGEVVGQVPPAETTVIPQGLKIICNGCNQLLSTKQDIDTHKCSQSKKKNPVTASKSFLTVSSSASSAPSKPAPPKKTYSRKKASPAKETNIQQSIVTTIQPQAQQLIIPTAGDCSLSTTTTNRVLPQILVVQTEDGSMMQIEIPVGVDINQLLNGNSTDFLTVSGEQQTALVVTTTDSAAVDSEPIVSHAGIQVDHEITEEQLNELLQENQQQINHDEQQLVFVTHSTGE